MTHLSPTTNPNAARVDDDDDHTIVVPPEDRCLVVLDGLRTPAAASERSPGLSRLGRGLAALLDASEHQPPPDDSDLLLKGFEALLGGKKAKPPDGLRKLRKPRQSSPDGLKTAAQAAAKLNCSIKTLNGHITSGALRYVVIGHGTKRPRKMFTDADLDEFITAQTRKDVPCPSTRPADRRSGTTISSAEVIGFTARRNARRAAKQKK